MKNTDRLLISTNDLNHLSAKKIFDAFPGVIRKRFGQNFLFDEKINRKIVAAAGDLREKVVVEIGPGPGGLTLEILKHPPKKLYVVELDPHWSNVWENIGQQLPEGRLEVIKKDALKFDLKNISPNIIISNLPYNISTQLLCRWMKEFEIYEKLVLMFQKEVADRLCAVPSTKDYGRLSVLVQLKSDIEKVFDIEPGSFFPPPKVKSTVVKITPKNYSLNDDTLDDTLKDTLNSTLNDTFSDLLKEMFAHKRKRVVKSLSLFFEKPEQILLEWGYGPNVRAEEITVKDYAKLAEHLFENKKEMKKNENNYV